MANYSSPIAGEIDTAAPFESVKEAVNMFGEKFDPKALKFPSAEKRASLELQHLRESLAATKEQLSQAQAARSSLFQELLETKHLVETKTAELAKVLSSKASTADIEFRPQTEELGRVANVVKERYEAAAADLAITQKEVERLKVELENSVQTIADIQERAHQAEADAKVTDRSSDELNEGLSDGRGDHEDHSLPMDSELENAATTVETINPMKQVETLNENVPLIKDAEMDLTAIDNLKEELRAARESEEKLAAEIADANDNIRKAKADLERARMSESKATEAVKDSAQELLHLKSKLSSLVEEKASLSAVSESLRDELAKAKMELAALKEAEFENFATSPAIAAELEKVKADLAAIIAAEFKAKETISGVTQALQQVTREADEAKLAAAAAVDEAYKAKVELDQAKAAMLTAESKLQAATREAQAAKAGETMALAELKNLTDKAANALGEEEAVGELQNECEGLRKKLQEAEELANMKVAAALAQVDAAKASEHEILTKLEATRAEVEANKSLVKHALQRAETAEAAKSAIENELRKRRKAADSTAIGVAARGSPFHGASHTPDRRIEPLAHTMHRRSLDYPPDHSFVSADVSAESIAQLLQLRVSPLKTSSEPLEKPSADDKQKKGKLFLPKLGSYLSRRKSSVGVTSPKSRLL